MDTPGRKVGTVKFFNSQKGEGCLKTDRTITWTTGLTVVAAQLGYGFIIPNEGDVEVFVHHTAIMNSGGFRSLMEGEVVCTNGPSKACERLSN